MPVSTVEKKAQKIPENVTEVKATKGLKSGAEVTGHSKHVAYNCAYCDVVNIVDKDTIFFICWNCERLNWTGR